MAGTVMEAAQADDGTTWELVMESGAADPVGCR